MGTSWSQFFPPTPQLTESTLPNQQGKVFLITGGYSGVGLELCSLLYHAGGRVYLAGRDKQKGEAAIETIKQSSSSSSSSSGEITFLYLSLSDLSTIKPAVDAFTATESRLDVLFNNAGVSNPPPGSVSAQSHELQLATNCLGPYLLTQLLLPTLNHTASISAPGSVRVTFTSSIVVDFQTLPTQELFALHVPHPSAQQQNYLHSKIGNWFLAHELDRENPAVTFLVLNPGNLKTALTRHLPAIVPFLVAPLLYHAKMGAYTALWAGLSTDLSLEDGGGYIIPWGRRHPSPKGDIVRAIEGGAATRFVGFCEEETREYRA
ncbi:hypothetical protein ASPZODRAFT_467703 [Penicilliopsis zonata CBS 506.65]|uniref:Ketoreductase (KR) domain-containing protein n=1 Tax=Penicilliopsis zonata CBS 506.65 TaxID=1073090 RepID=A0A1L9SXD9_9EURO|nr:hypothetical protein ASPZODRAFT_467703 [Penicilliopsis zonata CBS 506.65]OJJ51797.1 hypothetical protein ASPZODRAFT_467703 [Penicilliopsis zonata CBS 506.65]